MKMRKNIHSLVHHVMYVRAWPLVGIAKLRVRKILGGKKKKIFTYVNVISGAAAVFNTHTPAHTNKRDANIISV